MFDGNNRNRLESYAGLAVPPRRVFLASLMPSLARRVSVMDSTGCTLLWRADRVQAQRLIAEGLADPHQAREIRLTCNPQRAAGHSLPQYQDGQTAMMGPPLYTRAGEWTGAYGRR